MRSRNITFLLQTNRRRTIKIKQSIKNSLNTTMSDHLLKPSLHLNNFPISHSSHFTKPKPSLSVLPGVSIRKEFSCLTAAKVEEVEAASSVEMVKIAAEDCFDVVVADGNRVIILWMANWCRKCIYLKPKLEKLAAEYYPRVRFYCIDVNSVPQRLVNRAGITKMPTIQLWNDSKIQGEVNGGYTSWMVIEDIRRMIENEEP